MKISNGQNDSDDPFASYKNHIKVLQKRNAELMKQSTQTNTSQNNNNKIVCFDCGVEGHKRGDREC